MISRRQSRPARGSDTVIAVHEDGHASFVPELARQMNGARCAGGSVIVIDLLGVTLVDNETMAALCVALRQATVAGMHLRIVGADGRLPRILEVCEIDGLEFCPSIKRALARPRARLVGRARLSWRATAGRRQPGLRRSSSGPSE